MLYHRIIKHCVSLVPHAEGDGGDMLKAIVLCRWAPASERTGNHVCTLKSSTGLIRVCHRLKPESGGSGLLSVVVWRDSAQSSRCILYVQNQGQSDVIPATQSSAYRNSSASLNVWFWTNFCLLCKNFSMDPIVRYMTSGIAMYTLGSWSPDDVSAINQGAPKDHHGLPTAGRGLGHTCPHGLRRSQPWCHLNLRFLVSVL